MTTPDSPLSSTPTPEPAPSAGPNCAVATGSAASHLVRAYSHEEAINVAKQWMRENYGIPRDLPEESRDRYHEKLGLLIDFLWTLHPPESSPNTKVTHD